MGHTTVESQKLPQLPDPPVCVFSLLTTSQNPPETRDKIPQLLPGEGDRPLPQAGMYSYGMEVPPREQASPPPLRALLA